MWLSEVSVGITIFESKIIRLQHWPTPCSTNREKFNLKDQQEREVRAAENSGSSHIELPINSQDSCDSGLNDQFPLDENVCEEALSSRDSESTPPEPNSPQSRNEDQHEGSPTPDFSWEERSLDGSNIDWGRPSNSSSHCWQAEAVIQEPEPYIPQNTLHTECTWMSTPNPNQWGDLVVSGRALADGFLENFSENVEIRELLQRYSFHEFTVTFFHYDILCVRYVGAPLLWDRVLNDLFLLDQCDFNLFVLGASKVSWYNFGFVCTHLIIILQLVVWCTLLRKALNTCKVSDVHPSWLAPWIAAFVLLLIYACFIC